MTILLIILILIVLPLVLLYLIINSFLWPKANNWLTLQTDKTEWYRFFKILSIFTLAIFGSGLLIWLIFLTDAQRNAEYFGIGFVPFIPFLCVTFILLISSLVTRYLHFEKNFKTNNAIFVVMGILALPVGLFAALCIIWTAITIIYN